MVIGNGDNGDDLESYVEIKKGKIFTAKSKAVKLLKKFDTSTIDGLGTLLPEVENAKLYMTKKGLATKKPAELGAFTNDSQGLVYARTLPQPYAPTRFFPAATNLDDKQLITLHIHEALHRSLPDYIREDEKIVGEIAQTITSPEATKDQIKQIVSKYLQEPTANPTVTNLSNRMIMPHKDSRLLSPLSIWQRSTCSWNRT